MYCACSNNPHLGDMTTETERAQWCKTNCAVYTYAYLLYLDLHVRVKNNPLNHLHLSVCGVCTYAYLYLDPHTWSANNRLNHLHQLNDDTVKNGLCGEQIWLSSCPNTFKVIDTFFLCTTAAWCCCYWHRLLFKRKWIYLYRLTPSYVPLKTTRY